MKEFEETLESFPLVKQFIEEQFSQLPSVGHFRVYERRILPSG